MPVIEYNFAPPTITPDMLPVQIGFGPVGPFGFGGTPPIPIEIGTGAFDFGVKATYTCPGFPTCGKVGEACKFTYASRVISVPPESLVSLKIPGIPALPSKIGPFGFSLSFPPRGFRPFNCPNYPQSPNVT